MRARHLGIGMASGAAALIGACGGASSGPSDAVDGVALACARGAPAPGTPCERVYAVDNQSQDGVHWTVSVIDPRRRAVASRIEVAPRPHHIYPVPGHTIAYVSHFTGRRLEVLDMLTDRVTGEVTTGEGPRHLEFSPDGRVAYTDDYAGGTVSAIDTASGRTLGIVRVGAQPNYNAVSSGGRYVFVANSGESTVSVIDSRALRVVRTVTVGRRPAVTASHPFDLVLTPDGRQVVVTGAGDNSLSFIDTRTFQETASIALGGAAVEVPGQEQTQRLNVRIRTDGRDAWVGDQANSAWSVVDVISHALVSRIPAGLGADILFQPAGGPARGLGIGTARYSRRMTVVDPEHPARRRDVVTALGSHMIAFSRDWTLAYVSCRPGNAVSVIDLRTMEDVDDIAVGRFPDGIVDVWFDHGVAEQHG